MSHWVSGACDSFLFDFHHDSVRLNLASLETTKGGQHLIFKTLKKHVKY